MALRTFLAPDGLLWNVWDVRGAAGAPAHSPPRLRERRGQDVLLYTGPERRRGERRRSQPGVSVVPPAFAAGWLVFDCGGAKRRLAPPPTGWEGWPDERLVELWRRARPGAGEGAPPAP
ncbi:MAG TPA: hypothetical protein VGR37_16080 [Longimicrobiaceae bacterium]|nr:hypothetical protein [Longimicrobiaceae bacterium]